MLDEKCVSDLPPQQAIAHACLKAIRPTAVDNQHAWAAAFQIAATGRGGRHGHRKKRRKR
jgi:hypothetical protein